MYYLFKDPQTFLVREIGENAIELNVKLFASKEDLLEKLTYHYLVALRKKEPGEDKKEKTGEEKKEKTFVELRKDLDVWLIQLNTGSGKRAVKELEEPLKECFKDLGNDQAQIDFLLNEFKDAVSFVKSKNDEKNKSNLFFFMINRQIIDRYIAVFTSQPLEVQDTHGLQEKLLIKSRIFDMINCVLGIKENKKYNFNYPNISLCKNFYNEFAGFAGEVIQYRLKHETGFKKKLLESLNLKIESSKGSLPDHFKEDELKIAVDALIEKLNEKTLYVWCTPEPIYVIRFFITNPAAGKFSSSFGFLYLLSNDNGNTMEIFKMGDNDVASFKNNVWPLLKSNNKGIPIPYKDKDEVTMELKKKKTDEPPPHK